MDSVHRSAKMKWYRTTATYFPCFTIKTNGQLLLSTAFTSISTSCFDRKKPFNAEFGPRENISVLKTFQQIFARA